LARADFVQENGLERWDFKIKLFARMDGAKPACSRQHRRRTHEPRLVLAVPSAALLKKEAETKRANDRTKSGPRRNRLCEMRTMRSGQLDTDVRLRFALRKSTATSNSPTPIICSPQASAAIVLLIAISPRSTKLNGKMLTG
jgi:hypothetical protein